MPSYLYAVQDANGREIVAAHVDVEKVGDIRAEAFPSGPSATTVELLFEDITVAEGYVEGAQLPLTLHRWPSDEKLSDPVSHPVQ